MGRIRLYLDEDTIKGALVKALRNADLDVVTAVDAEMLGCSDEEQLKKLNISDANSFTWLTSFAINDIKFRANF